MFTCEVASPCSNRIFLLRGCRWTAGSRAVQPRHWMVRLSKISARRDTPHHPPRTVPEPLHPEWQSKNKMIFKFLNVPCHTGWFQVENAKYFCIFRVAKPWSDWRYMKFNKLTCDPSFTISQILKSYLGKIHAACVHHCRMPHQLFCRGKKSAQW